MKIKHLLIGLFAVAAAVACKQDEPVETPKLDVDKTAVSLAATAGEASFNVTSNQSWVASADADWVSLEPASGQASEKSVAVKVTAEDNETTEARKATVTVKAGELTKTVEVNQAAGAGEQPGPGPDLPQSEWALVGTFGESNNWNAASDLYLSVLDEEYFVYYGFELASDTEFKFLKGGAWPPAGQEIGGNGLVEPNTIQPAGGSNIKVTEAGKYDIYLAADLTKFYIMSEGKLPSEATEPAPVENQWGMMGCFVDNQWSSDVPMTKEGEWIVAKGAQFTELTFKIRANSSWADATNIGLAPGSERGVVNGKISVVTAEYSKANLGGDAADIKLNGEAGTYDVYFSFENLEVYVMEQGFKPGEKEPQNPEPVEITYTVVGTIADNAWVNNAAAGLMAAEGDYLVAKNIPFVWNSTCYGGDYNRIEFKIVETGTWSGYAYPEKNIDQYANAEITVSAGGENIAVDAPEGNYDVYFDKANLKVWVMEAGFKPGEKEPVVPAPADYDIDGKQWTFVWQAMGDASCVIDLGVTEPGTAILAYDMGLFDPASAGIYTPYMVGTYTIAKTDGTSGIVTLSADGQSVEIPYSNATENSVHFAAAALLQEDVDCTLATSLIEISLGTGPEPDPEDPNELKGDGTEANPYVLKTAEHMVAMRTLAVLGQATYFRMANDIDMASVANWTPVNWDENFEREVHFDGNGKTITNFAPTSFVSDDQTTAAQYPSLFGVLYGSCKNLTIKNSKIIVSETTPSCGFLGGYVGTAGKPAVVENVSVQGEVYGGSCVGALAGQSNGTTTYKNCTIDAVLTSAGTDLGGIVGKIRGDSEMTGCTVKATIVSKAINKNRVGGLIGWNSTATTTITDCHVLEGTTLTDQSGRTASDNGNYGGFIGYGDTSNTVLKISGCSAHTIIDAGISTYNAGFIGGTGYESTVEVTDSWAAGSVIGANYSAGFIGAIQSHVTISRCWADVDVTSSGQRCGAFAGCNTKFPATITNCYAKGDITATGQQVGGIIGYASFPITITNCYATGNVSSATAGTGGIAGTISAESTVSNCIAWNATIDCQRAANDKWAPGAVVGAASVAGNYSGCYRRADMNLIDAAGAMVLVDQEDVANGFPASPSYSEETTQAAYHGKAAAADATVSSVAKALGWPEDVWDLSGDLPKLK